MKFEGGGIGPVKPVRMLISVDRSSLSRFCTKVSYKIRNDDDRCTLVAHNQFHYPDILYPKVGMIGLNYRHPKVSMIGLNILAIQTSYLKPA